VWLSGMTLRLFAAATGAIFLFRAVRLAICSRGYQRTDKRNIYGVERIQTVSAPAVSGLHKIAAGTAASTVSR
jgi:hypothetical protein